LGPSMPVAVGGWRVRKTVVSIVTGKILVFAVGGVGGTIVVRPSMQTDNLQAQRFLDGRWKRWRSAVRRTPCHQMVIDAHTNCALASIPYGPWKKARQKAGQRVANTARAVAVSLPAEGCVFKTFRVFSSLSSTESSTFVLQNDHGIMYVARHAASMHPELEACYPTGAATRPDSCSHHAGTRTSTILKHGPALDLR
jgi:hypothetical protein